jgi:hypothetical protein
MLRFRKKDTRGGGADPVVHENNANNANNANNTTRKGKNGRPKVKDQSVREKP